MKYSCNWLKELTGTKKTAQEIANLITMHSFEVEEVEKFGSDFEGVVVGEILEIKKHPNADKLQLTRVNIGKEILSIVCGAHNISIGDKIPVATVGTVLPNGIQIKEAEIRSEKSFGMLCALDELGLGSDHSGIFLLDKKVKIGTNLGEIIGNKDEVLEIKILPDRGHDALSHVGMAREIAALEEKKIDYDFEGLILPKKKTAELLVEIEDKTICSRYIGAVMKNIKISQSPQWLKNRLEACGIRPINNVVDATNFVMLELGQPLHAFDCDIISGMQFPISNLQLSNKPQNQKAKIIIRRAKEAEEIILLDQATKKLSKEDIVIANDDEILALAGIMGGLKSGINENTKTIVLEAANFDATTIRKTRTRLNIITESALRFEKDLDPNLAEKAMVRLVEILEHIAGGKIDGIVDVYDNKIKPWDIKLDLDYVSRLLGIEIPASSCKKILESLDMKIKISGKKLVAEIPTYRIDLRSQENLIEEIGRIYGYEKIQSVAPKVSLIAAEINEQKNFEKSLKNILVGQGFSELYNYSFYSSADAEISQDTHFSLESPLSAEHLKLRTSLLPNILKNIKENLKNFKNFQVFELGRIYVFTDKSLPNEKRILAGAIVLEKKNSKLAAQDKRNISTFFEAKSAVNLMLNQIGVFDHYFDCLDGKTVESPKKIWHRTRSAEIKIEGSGKSLGFVGEINPSILEKYGINARVAMFEFDCEILEKNSTQDRDYTPISKYPVVVRDLSMQVEREISVDEILQVIQIAGGDIVMDVDLFDAIDFADNISSYAFHIILGAKDRTLTSNEIDEIIKTIINSLEKDLKVQIRK